MYGSRMYPDNFENEEKGTPKQDDHSERLAELKTGELLVFLAYPYAPGHGQLSAAWDRLRQICIDYQVVPPTATDLLHINGPIIWQEDDMGAAFNKLKNDLGFMTERIQHIVKMPDGRLVDLAAGCFIN